MANGNFDNNNRKMNNRVEKAGKNGNISSRQDMKSSARYVTSPRTAKKVVAAEIEPQIKTVRAKVKMPFPVSVVIVSVICTFLLLFMMFTMAQINEFTREISSLQTNLSKLTKEEEELKLQVELKNNLRVIEDTAVNELGMVKSEDVTKKYVVMENDDKVEVVVPETTENSIVNSVMSAIGENFRDMLEYIN